MWKILKCKMNKRERQRKKRAQTHREKVGHKRFIKGWLKGWEVVTKGETMR